VIAKISADEVKYSAAVVPTTERVWVARSGVEDPRHLGVFSLVIFSSPVLFLAGRTQGDGHIIADTELA